VLEVKVKKATPAFRELTVWRKDNYNKGYVVYAAVLKLAGCQDSIRQDG
jgi:hypothetical protein